jgi:hypothetical protein
MITGTSDHSAWLATCAHDKRARFACAVTPGTVVYDAKGAERHPAIFLATHGADVLRAWCDVLRSLGHHLTAIDGDHFEEMREVLPMHDAESSR